MYECPFVDLWEAAMPHEVKFSSRSLLAATRLGRTFNVVCPLERFSLHHRILCVVCPLLLAVPRHVGFLLNPNRS